MENVPLLGTAHTWLCAKPKRATIIVAVLVVLVLLFIILFGVYADKYHKCSKGTKPTFRSGFHTPAWLTGGPTQSNWWKGGSMHDQAYFNDAIQHKSQLGNAYQPAVWSKNALRGAYKGHHTMAVAAKRAATHRAAVKRAQAAHRAAMRREGLDPTNGGAAPAGPSNPLDPTTGYEGDEGGDWAFNPSVCPSSGTFDPLTGVMTVDTQTIGNVWDPDAIAEAQALASVGSYVNDPSGDEMAFQAAISSAYDANAAADTMNDAQLATMMALGTAP